MAKPSLSSSQKQAVARRASGCCEYCLCQVKYSPDPFSIEHIIPRSKGSDDSLENLALACQGCNNRKYVQPQAYDPVIGYIVPLYNPRQHQWQEHFVWSQDLTLMLGITPTGRATVDKLALNREGIVNLRRVLAALGKHPP
ncbi:MULTISPECIES: HNH endonuclease [Cyanophyceae]|uniref:HNH endonuclease n=1 Tax=Leptolyngbya subtilissima DQ-A4 TaxID=2933933 RepID=A0ABV0JXX1_9CYAN|nr:HNH endonuclease [Nodosilinea sp. FACHB-141]MBD2112004.1 HNH endonuclease [Nodosilinea sp. FACHB-141]